MVAGEWKKSVCGYSCAKVVGSSGNFHSKIECFLNMRDGVYSQMVNYPWIIDQNASIFLQQYQRMSFTPRIQR